MYGIMLPKDIQWRDLPASESTEDVATESASRIFKSVSARAYRHVKYTSWHRSQFNGMWGSSTGPVSANVGDLKSTLND